MIKALKRLGLPARQVHTLLRELLVYCLSFPEVDQNPGAGSFGLLASGVDGELDMANPQRLFSAAGGFIPGYTGKYLTVYSTGFNNAGVYRIIGVLDTNTLVVQGGLYGAAFTSDLGVSFRIVDPTLNTDATYYVVQGSGTTPGWQVRFFLNLADVDRIRFEVGPTGGWAAGWTLPVTAPQFVQQDATPMWYVLVQDTHIQLWTENAAGTNVFRFGYAGSGQTRRTTADPSFAVGSGGTPDLSVGSCFSAVASIGQDGITPVNYSALYYGDSTADLFVGLPSSPFDLRRDFALMPVGCETVGQQEDDRGYLRGLAWVPTGVGYREFVDNSRRWLSLGTGIAVEWDGSLAK